MNKAYFFVIISAIVVFCDQISKYIVRHQLIEGKSINAVGNIVYFTYVKNRGAAFGILQGARWIFIIIASIAVVIILFNIKFILSNNFLLVGSGLLLGGIVGNLIDRIFLGFVTDFIDFRFFPVFNIADSAVDIGLFISLIYFIFFDNGKSIKS